MNATIVDLRYNMKHVLRAIDRGETVTVLSRGKERDRLTPIAPATGSPAPKTKDQPLFGLWKDREDMTDPASYLRRLRPPRAAAQPGMKKQARVRKPK
jgi:antitoxin (DNA-binding transcriptional repressor) of toxin-antitoxin stability system